MPLSEVPTGKDFRIVAIQGGRALAVRLAGLGVTVGSEVRSLINNRRGPMLVLVRQTRLALGRGLAARIMVAPVEAASQGDSVGAGR